MLQMGDRSRLNERSRYTEIRLPVPTFTPAELQHLPVAFDHDDFIFELKMDGFRALAYVDEHQTRLVSRKGNTYKNFVDLCAAIHIDLDCTGRRFSLQTL